ncbi:sigma-70 family RNA polymerase sigma factor [bacterium]|nr:sigma-70 family RNA polymerase sigma factor [bacterium]
MVRQVLRGNRSAYADLVEAHQGRALACAHHLCGDFETAQDIAQEAFVQAYRSLHNLHDPAAFGAWLHGIVRNLCRKHLAKQPPPMASVEQDPVPEPAAPPDRTVEMDSLLQTLPLADREILAARYLQELDYEEIARMLGISVNNVRVRCFRARQALRAALAGQGGGLDG